MNINMNYYQWMYESDVKRIISAKPTFIIANSPAGPWKSNADIKRFQDAGIKYLEYLDGGYEGTKKGDIPNDLQSNLNFLSAIKDAGANGFYLDQVSSNVFGTGYGSGYLQAISKRAYELGLTGVFNVGVAYWADELTNLCDFISSSESWRGEALSPSQSKWKSKTWLLSKNTPDLLEAVRLSNAARVAGIAAHYACPDEFYKVLPDWFEDYLAYTHNAPILTIPDGGLLLDKAGVDKLKAIRDLADGLLKEVK